MVLAIVPLVVVLFVSLGFPRIPGTDIPIVFVLFPFLTTLPRAALGREKGFLISFSTLAVVFFIFGLLAYSLGLGDSNDLLFLSSITIKSVLNVFVGAILFQCWLKSPKSLLIWSAIQTVLVLVSSYDERVFDLLVRFSSNRSSGVINDLFGRRGVGFGLYHADGALLLALIALFCLIDKKSAGTLKRLGASATMFVALAVARTAIIPGIIFLVLRKKVFLLASIFVALFALAMSLEEEAGPFYQAIELFRNILYEGTARTASSDANLQMFAWPGDLRGWAVGYGRFYTSPGEFFGYTDLGWFRLLLFGGPICVVLFAALNLHWAWCSLKLTKGRSSQEKAFAALLVVTFLVVNFKGLFHVTAMGPFYYFFLRNATLEPVKPSPDPYKHSLGNSSGMSDADVSDSH